ncbi:MAG TPA: hypothetical protein VMU27_01150 [Candidatus Paceibacterota bacterium]|nr:hypothetical protein [Candidatus Paceibacterota bacterium]
MPTTICTLCSPQCVPLSDIEAVSKVVYLTPDQFQFVRALYVALPPVSRMLPPGDRAVEAIAGGDVMLGLVDERNEVCARFLAPDFIQTMLKEVGDGENEHLGTDT